MPEAIDILRARLERYGNVNFVFPGIGKTGHLAEPKKGWDRILKTAGITELRIHDLRRTLGSWQARTGASLTVIGKSLNHKSPMTASIYARLDLDPVRACFDDLKGFSTRNLKYMRKFAEKYPETAFVQQAAAQLPWFHVALILDKVTDRKDQISYFEKTVEHGWSRR